MLDNVVQSVRNDPRFLELEAERGRFGRTLAIIMLVIYFGFIFLVAFAPGLLAMPVSGVITLAFPLGLAVILSAILITGIYVLRANGRFDRLTREIVGAMQ
jgi:uncharacterized membrane protein (DUF485 family)